MAEQSRSPLAFCPAHGLFHAPGFNFGTDAANVTMPDCRVSCPRCDQMVEIIPGVYKSLPESLNLLIDPSISQEAHAALKDVAERLQRQEITAEQAKSEAEKIEPKAGSLFDLVNLDKETRNTILAAIVGAITGVLLTKIISPTLTTPFTPTDVIHNHIQQVQKTPINKETRKIKHSANLQNTSIPRQKPTKQPK